MDVQPQSGRSTFFELPVVSDDRGKLTFIEATQNIPFPIKRVYYLYDIADGAVRGEHAHRTLEQVMIAITGSFDVYMHDGLSEWVHRLDQPHTGLYIGPYIWHEIRNCSSDAVCLMLASMAYDESDYIREFDAFLSAVKSM